MADGGLKDVLPGQLSVALVQAPPGVDRAGDADGDRPVRGDGPAGGRARPDRLQRGLQIAHLQLGAATQGQQTGILLAPEHQAVRWVAIASGTSCFLVIIFQAVGGISMNNHAYIWFIDAHSKGVRRSNDL